MSANPWPPYLFLPPVVEYAAPKMLGVRDWLRLKILLSPAGGLDPAEARFWLAYGESKDADWHSTMDHIDHYFGSHWLDLLQVGRPLPFHLQRRTLRQAQGHTLAWRVSADRLEEKFKTWSHGPTLEW
jgi:hypothetical protein